MADEEKKVEDGSNGEERVSPVDAVVKLEEVELLRFNNLNLKIERAQQAVRLLQFENEQLHRQFVAATHERNMQIEKGQNTVSRLQKDIEKLAYELADKYGVPAKYLAIDDETGAIREMPHGPEDTESPPPAEEQAN
jgi:hypothetical protein